MIQSQIKLRLSPAQKSKCDEWLPILGSVFNFGIRKIGLNARDRVYFSIFEFNNLLANHSKRLDIPSHVLQGVLSQAWRAWQRCFDGIASRPRLKGFRRPMNSIPFPDPISLATKNKVQLPGLGKVGFHKQDIPDGKIKCGRLVKRASGYYLCLFIDTAPNHIERVTDNAIGVDPGFRDLLTLSTGEKIVHPGEYRRTEKRIGQAQRGRRRRLVARIQERNRNRRKDRNHKISRKLVAENAVICLLRDNHRAIAKRFGKSVSDSGHGGLRQMLEYKSLIGGTALTFPENRNSTRTCSTCGALTGPTGLAGLRVREWNCGACGAHHDRDVNAARNALISGVGRTHETVRQWAASGIPHKGSVNTLGWVSEGSLPHIL